MEGLLCQENGQPILWKGEYFIADGGYVKCQYMLDSFATTVCMEERIWSEWLESVRKDVECAFGIIKARFRFFQNPIELHSLPLIEAAWKTAIALHNMLITYDGNDLED